MQLPYNLVRYMQSTRAPRASSEGALDGVILTLVKHVDQLGDRSLHSTKRAQQHEHSATGAVQSAPHQQASATLKAKRGEVGADLPLPPPAPRTCA